MRISNISRFLPGANNVIATEVLVGNQSKKTIQVDGVDFTDANVTVDIDFQLFQGTLTQQGSKFTIGDDFAPVANTPIVQGDSSVLVSNQTTNSFDFLIPKELISQFTPAVTVEPNVSNPYIVVTKVQWTNGDIINSLRFLFVVRYQPNV